MANKLIVDILLVILLFVVVTPLISVPNDEFFSIVVLPDTQKYTENDALNAAFLLQTRWIVDNKEEYNIKFVIHEGDIVEHAKDDWEWTRAKSALGILDKHDIPYSVVPGNHDRPTKLYNKYYPASKFADKEWYGGNMPKKNDSNNNDNNYQLMSINGDDYIFLSLDFCPDKNEIKWANDTFSNYSNRRGILTTHGFLNDKAQRKVHVCGDTQYIWDDLIKHHGNLFLVLSGHVHNESRRLDENLAGNKVYQVLADYQERETGGAGWLRIMKFYENEIKVYTYSPLYEKFESDMDSEFVLEI